MSEAIFVGPRLNQGVEISTLKYLEMLFREKNLPAADSGFRPGYGLIREWSAQAAWQRDGSCPSCAHLSSFCVILQRFVVQWLFHGMVRSF